MVEPKQTNQNKILKPFWLLLALLTAIIGNGCGGFQAAHSFSPLDFLMPGGFLHIQNTPQTAPVAEETNMLVMLSGSQVGNWTPSWLFPTGDDDER